MFVNFYTFDATNIN